MFSNVKVYVLKQRSSVQRRCVCGSSPALFNQSSSLTKITLSSVAMLFPDAFVDAGSLPAVVLPAKSSPGTTYMYMSILCPQQTP